jgi:hypothetical protein
MEAKIKKELVYVVGLEPNDVIEKFPCDGTFGVIDLTGTLNFPPNGPINFKKYNSEDGAKAWNQIKRWVSSQSFDQVFVAGALDFLSPEMVYDWLFDHKDKKGFPKLIFSGKKIQSPMEKIANTIL